MSIAKVPFNGMKLLASLLIVLWLAGIPGAAAELNDAEKAYVVRFEKRYTPVNNPVPLRELATVERFDAEVLGENWEKLRQEMSDLDNVKGRLAWGVSYYMVGLCDIYRVTGDIKYLRALRRCARNVLDARDDRRAVRLFNGRVAPIWSILRWEDRGRTAHLVNTGMITYPILDFLLLARDDERFMNELDDREWGDILAAVRQSVAYLLPQASIQEPTPKDRLHEGGEDISHGALSVAFPLMLYHDREVFTREDMGRFSRTVTQGFARLGNGVLLGNLTGTPDADPRFAKRSGRWLRLAAVDPEVYDVIGRFLERFPGSVDGMTIALLLRYCPKRR